jgi:hypothetical protein
MKSLAFFVTLAGCTVVLSTAARADSDSGGGTAGVYELKNHSVFRSDADARIPFWPIGWQRPNVKAGAGGGSAVVVDTPKVLLQPNHFNISSILLGNPALVTINGRSFEEGEFLPVIYGSQRLRVIVRSIRDGGVWLDHEGQQTFIPMRRPEVGLKPSQQKVEPAEFAIKIAPGQQ